MNTLPWHVQLKIYHNIGIDTLHKLKIKPGKINIPSKLQESLTKCLQNKKHYLNNAVPWCTEVILPIKDTNKKYKLYRRFDDGIIVTHISIIRKNEYNFYNEISDIILYEKSDKFGCCSLETMILIK
jgi:hypothetical protein